MVNILGDAARWRAPEPLEDVRRFLNTWDYAPRRRATRDHLPALTRDAGAWRRRFASVRRPKQAEIDELVSLRDGLRQAVEHELDEVWLNHQLRAARLTVGVAQDPGGTARICFRPDGEATAVADVLVIVLEAIRDGTWVRLKACPDCRLVFFDRSRNASRRWCQMSAKGGGRACGSIAKVRNWRSRKAGDTA
jgi:predicted RNA-binding Zn ribbon-like protein